MVYLRSVRWHLLSTICFLAVFAVSLSTAAAQTLITTDSLLNTGTPISTTYTAPGTSGANGPVTDAANSAATLWLMYDNPWGVTSGNGSITQSYTGNGAITTAINLSGLPGGGVDGSPFVLYGCDEWSDCFNGQPPQFPKQLSAMSSLVIDFNYALSGTITGRDIDLIFDEWVCNSNHPTSSSQCLEVEVLPYYSFIYFGGGTFVKTINEPVTLNGAPSTFSFDEYVGGTNVLFYPHTMPGIASAQLRFNLLDFLTAGVAAFGNNTYQYLAGIELGTEFGASSSQSYTLNLTKLDIEQTLAGTNTAPAAPTNLTAIAQ